MKHRVVISLGLIYEGAPPSRTQTHSDAEIVRSLAEKHTAGSVVFVRTVSLPEMVDERPHCNTCGKPMTNTEGPDLNCGGTCFECTELLEGEVER